MKQVSHNQDYLKIQLPGHMEQLREGFGVRGDRDPDGHYEL